MSISQNFPATWPSLTLDFANSKTVDPRITFTRASTGTYVGADGLVKTAVADQARFDHDPATGESLGLLIEESRSNVWLNSELPANWLQVSLSSVANNYTISPSGTQTAGRIVFSGTTSNWDIVYQGTFTGTYIWSAWLKTEDGSAKTVYVTWGPPDASKRVALSIDGTWRRYSALVTPSNENVHLGNHHTLTPAGWSSFAIHIWGAQLEAGSFPTSYIPTSGSQVTRSQDLAIISGTNFSPWYNPSEGTAFISARMKTSNGATGIPAYAFKSTANSNYYYGFSRDNVNPYHYVNTSDVNSYLYGTLSSSGSYKASLGIKQNSINSYINGVQNYNTTTATLFTPDILYLGGGYTATNILNGHISQFKYYPIRITDSQLQALTK